MESYFNYPVRIYVVVQLQIYFNYAMQTKGTFVKILRNSKESETADCRLLHVDVTCRVSDTRKREDIFLVIKTDICYSAL